MWDVGCRSVFQWHGCPGGGGEAEHIIHLTVQGAGLGLTIVALSSFATSSRCLPDRGGRVTRVKGVVDAARTGWT